MNSELILCSGIKLDRNYENVLSYNENTMLNLCRQNAIYTGNKYKIVGVRGNKINVSAKYADCIYANYMAFINPNYGNKWFFAWITDVNLLNPDTTEITFVVDVFSTWYDRFVLGQAFIEREHVDDDTFGKHTIPEGLETGDFIINSLEELGNTALNTRYIAMVYTGNPQQLFPSYSAKEYTGLYTGYNYMILASGLDADKMIQGFSDDGALEMIYGFFTIPSGLIRSSVHWYNGPNATGDDVIEVGNGNYPMFALVPEDPVGSHNEITLLANTNFNINTTINGYTPKNNKLFTGEYNYIYATNNSGADIKYNYEDFINNQPIFKIIGAISIGCSIKLVPMNYKKFDTTSQNTPVNGTYIYGINGGKYPTLGWTGDAYTNWLTQNAVNIAVGTVGNIGQILGGVAMLGTGVTAVAGGSSIFSGFTGILNQLGEIRKHQLISETGSGNINAGDLAYSTKKMNFSMYRMSIKEETARIIDNYFSRFGYKVNEVKTPNLNSRTKFNFIKVGGMDELVSGNIPANALEEINSIFRKGVTIFHNYNDIGNYTISNPIVS